MTQFTAIPAYNPPAPVKSVTSVPDKSGDDFADLLDTVTDVPKDEPAAKPADEPEVAEAAPEPSGSKDDSAGIDELGYGPKIDEVKEEVSDVLESLTDVLAQLQAVVQKGEEPDPKLVKRAGMIINALASLIGFKTGDAPTASELAAMGSRAPVTGEPIQTQLQKLLAPLAQSLTADTTKTDLTALGNKLGAMLKAIGNADDQTIDVMAPQIQQAIEKLSKNALGAAAAAPATPDVPADQTVADTDINIAKPALDVPTAETKPATAAAPATGTSTDSQIKAAKDTARDPKAKDLKPDLAASIAAAAAADAQPDGQGAAQATAQQAKVDTAIVAPRPLVPGYQTSQQQLNLPQLAFELAHQAHAGNTRFQIRLDPAELGRIDVKLDIDATGQVNARLTVEKAETLDLMQRDQRALEKALQQAGLDGTKTNLEFSLKQNSFAQNQNQQGQSGQGGGSLFGDQQAGADADEGPVPTVNLYRGNLSASGVNILA